MRDDPHRPPADRQETVERREVVHRTTDREPRDPPPPPPSGAGLNWLLLAVLLLVVLGLVWFIFTRGEPQQPLQDVNVEVPTVEAPTVREERRIEVRTPAADPPPQPEAQPPTDP